MNLNKRRILHIEDHENTADLVRMVLEERNYEIVVVERTIGAALKTVRQQAFDLYLLDYWLPDGSGR